MTRFCNAWRFYRKCSRRTVAIKECVEQTPLEIVLLLIIQILEHFFLIYSILMYIESNDDSLADLKSLFQIKCMFDFKSKNSQNVS